MDPILACPVPRCGQMVLRPSVGVHLLVKHRWSASRLEKWEEKTGRALAHTTGDGKGPGVQASEIVAE